MDARLLSMYPSIAVDYGLYRSIKKDSGDYVDFLLHYDAEGSQNGDQSWITDLIGEDAQSMLNSPEILQALGNSNVDLEKTLGSGNFFDTQVTAYKLQLAQAFQKRYENENLPDEVKKAKISSLYSDIANIKTPSRLLGLSSGVN